jgi:hypothetical protein
MDGVAVARDVPYGSGYIGQAVTGIYLHSGHGGRGAPVQFADMRVTVRDPSRREDASRAAYLAPLNLRPRDRISLVSGHINGIAMDTDHPIVTVATGRAIRGTLHVVVHNAHESAAEFPIIVTPTWGDHATSWRSASASTPTGTSRLRIAVDLIGPSVPGEYAIIVAGAAEARPEFVASGTNWPQLSPQWNNGTDIASWTTGRIETLVTSGAAIAPWVGGSGRQREVAVAATAVRVRAIR